MHTSTKCHYKKRPPEFLERKVSVLAALWDGAESSVPSTPTSSAMSHHSPQMDRSFSSTNYGDAEWRYRIEKEIAEVKHSVSIINDKLDHVIWLISELKETEAAAESFPTDTLFLPTLQSALIPESDHPSCVLTRLRDMRDMSVQDVYVEYTKEVKTASGSLPGLRELTRSQKYKGQKAVSQKLRTAVRRRKIIADEVEMQIRILGHEEAAIQEVERMRLVVNGKNESLWKLADRLSKEKHQGNRFVDTSNE